MACFLVGATEAVVVTGIQKYVEKHERTHEAHIESTDPLETTPKRVPLSRKLKWLTYMLWGGAFLLAYEHIWHGEVVPWFPFLTAMSNPADTASMIHEMSTIGVTMAVIVTVTWAIMCKVADHLLAKQQDGSVVGTEA